MREIEFSELNKLAYLVNKTEISDRYDADNILNSINISLAAYQFRKYMNYFLRYTVHEESNHYIRRETASSKKFVSPESNLSKLFEESALYFYNYNGQYIYMGLQIEKNGLYIVINANNSPVSKAKKIKYITDDIDGVAERIANKADEYEKIDAAKYIDSIDISDGLLRLYEDVAHRSSHVYTREYGEYAQYAGRELRGTIDYYLKKHYRQISKYDSAYTRVPEYHKNLYSDRMTRINGIAETNFYVELKNGLVVRIGLIETYGLSIAVTSCAINGKSINIKINTADFGKTINGIEKALVEFTSKYTQIEATLLMENAKQIDYNEHILNCGVSKLSVESGILNSVVLSLCKVFNTKSVECNNQIWVSNTLSVLISEINIECNKPYIKVIAQNGAKKANKKIDIASNTIISTIYNLAKSVN